MTKQKELQQSLNP